MLYFVATPIGNLADVSFRAIETLKKSDYILCEDTRTSQTFLNRYDIKKQQDYLYPGIHLMQGRLPRKILS